MSMQLHFQTDPELLIGIEKAISNGRHDMPEFIPKFQELYKLKDERIAKLRNEIDAIEEEKGTLHRNNHRRF